MKQNVLNVVLLCLAFVLRVIFSHAFVRRSLVIRHLLYRQIVYILGLVVLVIKKGRKRSGWNGNAWRYK